MSRDITYANLINCLYDLLGFDRIKYDLVLKVIYQLREEIIAPTMISNNEYLGLILDEISISIQHRTPLYVLVVERTIPTVPNPTRDSQFLSFMPETTEAVKIHGHEVVLGKLASET